MGCNGDPIAAFNGEKDGAVVLTAGGHEELSA
jgi:hypothetical protein